MEFLLWSERFPCPARIEPGTSSSESQRLTHRATEAHESIYSIRKTIIAETVCITGTSLVFLYAVRGMTVLLMFAKIIFS